MNSLAQSGYAHIGGGADAQKAQTLLGDLHRELDNIEVSASFINMRVRTAIGMPANVPQAAAQGPQPPSVPTLLGLRARMQQLSVLLADLNNEVQGL